MSLHRKQLSLVIIATLLAALPVSSQSNKSPPTQAWIDVATHDFSGMPDMGPMGNLAMGVFGGGRKGNNAYGLTRYTGAPGKYMDVAVWNSLNPGVAAQQDIPGVLKMGKSLKLLSYKPSPQPGGSETEMPDFKSRILIYWGCGNTIRKGQPRVIESSSKDGKVKASGAFEGRYVPDRTVKITPDHVTWPNEKNRQNVPSGASLIGDHAFVGAGIPASLKFAIQNAQDFMPKIQLFSSGSVENGMLWRWQPVTQARGYFLHAVGQKGDATIFWSSSELAEAGQGILDYLPNATVDKWTKERVILNPQTTSCAIPKGIFESSTDANPGGSMLRMIAFGPEAHIVYPPKPDDAKTPWSPEWSVRIRVKSTAFAPIGMDMGEQDEPQEEDDGKKSNKKKILQGIFGG